MGTSKQITHNNFKQLKIGMAKNDVETILGKPRWDVKPTDPLWIDLATIDCDVYSFPDEWWGAEGVIRVWYANDAVWNLDFTKHRCEVVPLSIWERLQRILQRKGTDEEKMEYLEE
jgi:hypothetical protein